MCARVGEAKGLGRVLMDEVRIKKSSQKIQQKKTQERSRETGENEQE